MIKLTKIQKILILVSIFWEMFAYNISYYNYGHRLDFERFMLASSPVILYWSVVWIWGFGTFEKLFKKIFFSIQNNIINVVAFSLFFIVGFNIRSNGNIYNDIFYSLGGGIAGLFVGLIVFYIAVILTSFVKDLKKRKIAVSLLFFALSILYYLLSFIFLPSMEQKQLQELKQQVLDVVDKGENVTDDDIQSIQNEDIKKFFNMAIETAKELGEYANNNNISGITKIGEENLYKTKDGLKILYDRGEEIVKQVNGLNVEEDISQIYSGYIDKFYNDCSQKHPNAAETCVKFSSKMNNIINQQKVDISLLLKRKVDLVNLEYNAIKCMYENYGTNSCEDIKHEYVAKALEIENKTKELQDNYKNKAIQDIKGMDELTQEAEYQGKVKFKPLKVD